MHSTAVLPALCVDSISAVEAFHISDSHIVPSHADGPLEMSGRRVVGKRRMHFRSDRTNKKRLRRSVRNRERSLHSTLLHRTR